MLPRVYSWPFSHPTAVLFSGDTEDILSFPRTPDGGQTIPGASVLSNFPTPKRSVQRGIPVVVAVSRPAISLAGTDRYEISIAGTYHDPRTLTIRASAGSFHAVARVTHLARESTRLIPAYPAIIQSRAKPVLCWA